MSDAERREQVTRDSILKLLSDEENARVSTAETASGLIEGEEYLDLEDLDQGVQRAKASTAKAKMGHVLPRSAVSEETWGKILVQLTDETPMYQTQYPVSAQETVGNVRAAIRRLYHNPGFVIHFATYLAVKCIAHRDQPGHHPGQVLVLLAIARLGTRNRRTCIRSVAALETILAKSAPWNTPCQA